MSSRKHAQVRVLNSLGDCLGPIFAVYKEKGRQVSGFYFLRATAERSFADWVLEALRIGQLVKDEHYTLFESVSALEVGIRDEAWWYRC